jgi:predicted nucleotidyltransferase
MNPEITPEDMESYKRTALNLLQAEQRQVEARRERAWELAHRAARLLKEEFDVKRTVVFGSLIYPGRFTLWSDVDLASWGLSTKNWLSAIGAVHSLSRDVEFNLVDVTTCSPELLAAIEEGVEL